MRERLLRLRDNMDAAAYYESKLDELSEEIAECVGYIEDLEDPQARTALHMRYVEGMSWIQISRRMRGVSSDAIRMIHNRVLGVQKDGYSRRRR